MLSVALNSKVSIHGIQHQHIFIDLNSNICHCLPFVGGGGVLPLPFMGAGSGLFSPLMGGYWWAIVTLDCAGGPLLALVGVVGCYQHQWGVVLGHCWHCWGVVGCTVVMQLSSCCIVWSLSIDIVIVSCHRLLVGQFRQVGMGVITNG